jgi:hypothetical protein
MLKTTLNFSKEIWSCQYRSGFGGFWFFYFGGLSSIKSGRITGFGGQY